MEHLLTLEQLDKSLSTAYATLDQEVYPNFTTAEGKLPQNLPKNRYPDVLRTYR